MARLPPGQSMWIAYPDGIERVEIVRKGTGGRRYRDKSKKPEDPYVVENDDEEFVVSSRDLFDTPVEASVRRAEMCRDIGIDPSDVRLTNPAEDEEPEEPEEDDDDDDDDSDEESGEEEDDEEEEEEDEGDEDPDE